MTKNLLKPSIEIVPSRPAVCRDQATELFVLARIIHVCLATLGESVDTRCHQRLTGWWRRPAGNWVVVWPV